jgi:glycosyltransferase involved in cell wall biosynthesis
LVDVIIPGELRASESFAQALARHPDRDVVICSREDAIDEERLARLAAAARAESSVATLGALSRHGPARYRGIGSDASLAALFASENDGVRVEVPSALPSLVYVTRRALDACGGLESAEPAALVDFCARATDAGLRHLLCADVYAPAAGSDDDVARWKTAIEDSALAAAWTEFARRAPVTPIGRRVDLARLRASRLPRVLHITHDWGGGVERHVVDLSRLLADDCEVLVLRPDASGTVRLQWLRDGEDLQAWFDSPAQWEVLADLLRALGVARVHIHHVHGLPREVLELPRALGVPYDITLHDHYPVCPQYHLSDEAGSYCGEPDERGCNACIAKRPAQWGGDIAAWRGLFHGVLRAAGRVIVPSADMANRVQRYFPDVQAQVWPHPEMRPAAESIHKVVVLGGLSPIKGVDLFEACVRDAAARALPLHFQVLGHVSRPLEVPPQARVTVLGSYEDARLASLVALERPDAFLFLSQVPESYSYTLTIAMQTGKPIVATQHGAFPERLRGYPAASLVARDAPARAVNDTLLRLAQSAGTPVSSRPIAVSAHRA